MIDRAYDLKYHFIFLFLPITKETHFTITINLKKNKLIFFEFFTVILFFDDLVKSLDL